QELGLFDWRTVEENIMFPLRVHTSLKKEEVKIIVQKIIEDLRLKGSEELYPDQLSGGMQRRVALGRILALNPEIILLDEPTSGLDPVIAATVEDLLKDINRKMGKTLVVISHVIETTLNISDFIGVIFRGELVGFGNKAEIVNSTHPVIKQYFSRSAQGPITEGI
ncbi:ATP-binding cassette domain-containing protein, partial [Thermococcus sp.]|uniref:ABC transporter ATP-binding protein n=1 Tax=Thermococcus sp. TaxID=35749 RepID=UPI00263282E5